MATESTEEHGKIKEISLIFSCSSVDSVAKLFFLLNLSGQGTTFCHQLVDGRSDMLVTVCIRVNLV